MVFVKYVFKVIVDYGIREKCMAVSRIEKVEEEEVKGHTCDFPA